MDADFWHERWALNEIGFHRSDDHPQLVAHFHELGSAPGETVFVPLCGKSLDLLFLRRQGLSVVGVELSGQALGDFFSGNKLPLEKNPTEHGPLWTTDGIRILEGDFFSLGPEFLDGARLVYDRAALIALPEEMRRRYARKLSALIPAGGRMLLITNSYDPSEMEGPPFSVSPDEVAQLYGGDFEIRALADFESIDHHPGLKERGLSSFLTHTFLLTRR